MMIQDKVSAWIGYMYLCINWIYSVEYNQVLTKLALRVTTKWVFCKSVTWSDN